MKCFNSPRGSWDSRLSPPIVAAIAALIALASSLSACAAPAPDVPSAISHSARVDEGNGQIAFVSVVLSAPARVAVEYENEFAGKFRTALSETAVEHIVPVVRLRADTVYQYEVGVEKADGDFAYQARGEFTTGGLPGILSTTRSESSGRSSLDLIFADYTAHRLEGRHERSIVAMDSLGYAVWSHILAFQQGMHPFRILPGGNIIYQQDGRRIEEATPLGEVAGEIVIPPGDDHAHHDFLPLEDGRLLYLGKRILYLDDSAVGEGGETEMRVDGINAYDPAAGEIERVWDPLDFWDMRDLTRWKSENPNEMSWPHTNSLEKSADGGYIVSLRNLNQVISLSPDFKTVRWRLGGHDGDFDFPDPTDRFTMQHTATELPNGNILVFDNRAKLPEEEGGGYYSRALELRLDFNSMTAVKAWEFSPEPRIYSNIRSSAYRLDNGNTLVNFGHSQDPAVIPIAIIEADAQGREVFRLDTIDPPAGYSGPSRYRAYPGPKSIMGETMLRPPKRR